MVAKCIKDIVLIVFMQLFGEPSCIIKVDWSNYKCSFQQVYDFQINNTHFGVKLLMFQWIFPLARKSFYVT
jgi:hypothetical protein